MVAKWIAFGGCTGLATDIRLMPMTTAWRIARGLRPRMNVAGHIRYRLAKVITGKTETETLCALGEGTVLMTVGAFPAVRDLPPPPHRPGNSCSP